MREAAMIGEALRPLIEAAEAAIPNGYENHDTTGKASMRLRAAQNRFREELPAHLLALARACTALASRPAPGPEDGGDGRVDCTP